MNAFCINRLGDIGAEERGASDHHSFTHSLTHSFALEDIHVALELSVVIAIIHSIS